MSDQIKTSGGPLRGLRIIEMAAIGPVPFAGMLLSDMGAEVIRIDRSNASPNPYDVTSRGRKSIALNLKHEEGRQVALSLIESADILLEGFRPGVMEKLGLGPEICHQRNARLVYGRMTGWGQQGPLAGAAGHDINYIAITGALHAIGGDKPAPPLNLVGDLGGGALYLVMGVLSAYIHAKSCGQGQVVDSAITDGTISLLSCIHGFAASGLWQDQRQQNILDGGAHFYNTYECADGEYISVGAIEPQFFQLLVEKTGFQPSGDSRQSHFDSNGWETGRRDLADLFRQKSQAQWIDLLEGSDVCFAPVLSLKEAMFHSHNIARGNFVEVEGVIQSAPAPRFDQTPSQIQGPIVKPGQNSREILQQLELDADVLIHSEVVTEPSNSV
ncbi:CoA transferase [Pseudomaricurvus alkylphenolicus]|uniref:CaiB/BaiF CoA transferase family protein n=1 Tax=Pseudomaricurvus alkylphenolicus TaxID=1306991 RepID=UPI0014249469|nr:CaiB/BaiF CoA-transferase family protein [Pseudomaricurvus alkylphenolicus]NIB38953.1 CoA transferase [Pseudomaricurvus alkylphenolicus]